MNRTRAYWLCQLGGWGLNALGEVALILLLSPYVLWGTFINVLNIPLGIGITHVYRVVIRWRNWTSLPLKSLAVRVALATIVLSVLFVAGSTAIALALNPWSPFGGVTIQVSSLLQFSLRMSPTMLLWSVLYFGIHFFWNYRSAEVDRLKLAVQSRDAKLNALKLQLNPHFLFNSLNSVRALVTEAPHQAQTMITRLARLLRTTLKSSKILTVPLHDELKLVRTYLELEAVRLEERLAFTIDMEPDAREVPVPPMLVQTLVENGIKHGIATRPEGGTIHVEARLKYNGLQLCVVNTGRLDSDTDDGGLGLQNVRERLHLLFGDDATLNLRMTGPDTVVAEAWLPQDQDALPIHELPDRKLPIPEPTGDGSPFA
jgi:two-component sensor histidine kinase